MGLQEKESQAAANILTDEITLLKQRLPKVDPNEKNKGSEDNKKEDDKKMQKIALVLDPFFKQKTIPQIEIKEKQLKSSLVTRRKYSDNGISLKQKKVDFKIDEVKD